VKSGRRGGRPGRTLAEPLKPQKKRGGGLLEEAIEGERDGWVTGVGRFMAGGDTIP